MLESPSTNNLDILYMLDKPNDFMDKMKKTYEKRLYQNISGHDYIKYLIYFTFCDIIYIKVVKVCVPNQSLMIF